MSFVTLTTDFGHKDPYLAQLKAAIYSYHSEAKLVDISHEVAPYNTLEASYILSSSYKTFPTGTVHFVSVDSQIREDAPPIIMEFNAHLFVGTDNGIFSLVTAGQHFQKAVKINFDGLEKSTFPSKNFYARILALLGKGEKMEAFGRPIQEITKAQLVQPQEYESGLIGHVLYIDRMGNLITNIEKSMFFKTFGTSDFEINVRGVKIRQITEGYGSSTNQDPFSPAHALAIFNDENRLEICIFKGSEKSGGGARSLLGMDYSDAFKISRI